MQNLTRRRFLKISSMALAGTTLAACAPASAPGGESAAAPEGAAEQTKVTYLVRSDIGAKMLEWNDLAVADFSEQHPEIAVEMIGVPWGDYNAKLLAMYAAGTPPEISANYAAGFPTFYANDAITALDDFVAATNSDLSKIEQAAIDSVTREGKLWAMPLAHMPTIVFYHADMIENAGLALPTSDASDQSWTLDEMLAHAEAMAHDVDDPTIAEWGLVMTAGQLGVHSWLWGIDPFNDVGGPENTEAYQTGLVGEAFYNTPEFIDYMQTLQDNTYVRNISPRPSDTDAINQTVGWPMMSGKIGMYVNGAWAFTNFANVLPEWRWGVAPLPWGPAEVNTTPLFNDSWMLSDGAAEPEAGWTFLKYLTLENGAKLYAETTGFFPANKDNYNVFFDSIMEIPNLVNSREELEQVMLGSFEFGYPTPGKTLDSYPEWNQAFNQTTAPIWNNEATVEDGMAAVQEKFDSIIAQKA